VGVAKRIFTGSVFGISVCFTWSFQKMMQFGSSVDKRSRVYGRLKEVKISRGSAISPASAVAAAVSGDAR